MQSFLFVFLFEVIFMRELKLLAISLSICFSLSTCQKEEEKGFARPGQVLQFSMDSLVNHEHNAGRFNGTILIGTQDSVFYKKAVGLANRVWNVPLHTDHRFDIASLNKSFIAALILKAVEEGQLNINDHLSDLLGSYQYKGSFNPKITIHHMLTHTSGLPDYDAVIKELSVDNFRKFKRMHFSNAEYIDFISQLKPVDDPGKQFYYSNFAYHLLAIILEDLYKQTFSDLLQDKICRPLNLTNTFSSTANQEVHKKIVEAYIYLNEDHKWKRNNFIDLTIGRRIFSSVTDLYKWGKALNDTSLLSYGSLELIKTNHLSDITTEISYGYGWVIYGSKSKYKMGYLPVKKPYMIHGGSTEGYKSLLVNINDGEFIITLLSNIGDRSDELVMAEKIVNLINNYNAEI